MPLVPLGKSKLRLGEVVSVMQAFHSPCTHSSTIWGHICVIPKSQTLVYNDSDSIWQYSLIANVIPEFIFQDSESWMSVIKIFLKHAHHPPVSSFAPKS